MSEEWRPVVGYEGYYEVSDQGRVRGVERLIKSSRGFRTLPSALLQGTRNKQTKYVQVALSREGRRKLVAVHALVAAAFIGPRPKGLEVRHLDGNHSNDRRTNLKYGTPSQNRHDSVRHGTHGRLLKNRGE